MPNVFLLIILFNWKFEIGNYLEFGISRVEREVSRERLSNT